MSIASRDEWLARRRQGITGTDVAAIAGLTPWKRPLDVWLEKQGNAEELTQKYIRIGTAMEPVVGLLYEEETGRRLKKAPKGFDLRVMPGRPWAMATLDRETRREDGGFPVELKTAGSVAAARFGDSGTDQVPDYYLVQVAWQMAVVCADRADIAAFLGGQPLDFRVYTINRDTDLILDLVEMAEEWYQKHIVHGEQPPLDGSASSSSYIAKKFPRSNEYIQVATAKDQEVALALATARKTLKEEEEEVERLTNLLKESIGENSGLQGDGWRVTWKTDKDRRTVNYQGIIEEAKVPQAIIDQFTTWSPGSRRFLFTVDKDWK